MVKKLKTMMPAACKLISGFHAEMPHKIKKKILKHFAEIKLRILVVTLHSFAAGMDFPHVSSAYLLNIPENVEQFWQALSRAGRDGKQASVYLFADVYDTAKAIADSTDLYSTRIVLRAFGFSVNCRLKETLDYIDGINSTNHCGHCDLCQHHSSTDIYTQVHELLKFVENSVEHKQNLRAVLESSDAVSTRATLEMGALCVRYDQSSRKNLILSVATDDASRQRLRPSCTSPLLVYRDACGIHESKKRRRSFHE